jgi:hypothetical protein
MKALMNIVTEDPAAAHDEQLAAISQLIADRTEEENSPSKLSTDAFVSLANKMGLSLTRDTLMDLAQSGKLGAIIKDVNDDEIQFKGQHEIDGAVMDVDKAKKVVSKMARRNARKGVYGKYE